MSRFSEYGVFIRINNVEVKVRYDPTGCQYPVLVGTSSSSGDPKPLKRKCRVIVSLSTSYFV